MAFWRENMPEGLFLRSGPDWHLDAAGAHTLEAFLEERAIAPEDVDPIPIRVFLEYAEWFQQAKSLEVRDQLVADLGSDNGSFQATLTSGERVVADTVVCAPGIRHFTNVPDWARSVPPAQAAHTCDLVRFDELTGKRVLIVGGRQSAYEWAALLRQHGADRIDIVHRHDLPRFERVSWKFVDAHVQSTIDVRGYWRNLPQAQQRAIGQRFWEVGRLTLEYWLTPRLDWERIHRRPRSDVMQILPRDRSGDLQVVLSNSDRLRVDQVVFASGYRADLTRVPYMAGVLREIELADGFPALDEAFGTTLRGLYVTGFSATRDFGPFFGFVKGAPAAATLIVRDLLARA
jgi:FAD-dependent urate hydroxylase